MTVLIADDICTRRDFGLKKLRNSGIEIGNKACVNYPNNTVMVKIPYIVFMLNFLRKYPLEFLCNPFFIFPV